jgi:signal transduction histidine kinase
MKQAIDDTVQVTRRIAHDLRPGLLDDLGVLAALEWEAQKFESRTGIACTFTGPISDIELDPERSTAIFRICQEVLTNVARHAGASQVTIEATVENGDFVLTVNDNGRGIREEDLTNTKSLGLLSMRERVLPWHGGVDFRGVPDAGTTVTVTLPLPHHQPAD